MRKDVIFRRSKGQSGAQHWTPSFGGCLAVLPGSRAKHRITPWPSGSGIRREGVDRTKKKKEKKKRENESNRQTMIMIMGERDRTRVGIWEKWFWWNCECIAHGLMPSRCCPKENLGPKGP